MEMKEMIARINFLARKKRTTGLTESELIEQKGKTKAGQHHLCG